MCKPALKKAAAIARHTDGGVGCRPSTSSSVADADAAKDVLGLGEPPVTLLGFGYQAKQLPAESRSQEWSARANRRPLLESVERL